MTWILLVGAAWPVAAVPAAVVLGRMIRRADGQAADAAPDLVVDAPVAHGRPALVGPTTGSPV